MIDQAIIDYIDQQIGDQQINPGRLMMLKDGFIYEHTFKNTEPQTAANFGTFFIAPFACEPIRVLESHSTRETSGTHTLNIEKLAPGTAPGAGINLLGTAYDLTSAIDTPIIKKNTDLVTTKTGSKFDLQLDEKDRLAFVLVGTPSLIKNLTVAIYFKWLGRGKYRT